MIRLPDDRLRIAALQSIRWRSRLSLFPAGLLLIVTAVCSWLVPVLWPKNELPIWRRSLCIALSINLIYLALESLLSLALRAAVRLFSKRRLETMTLLEFVRVAVSTTLLLLKLRLYTRSIDSDDWNDDTLYVIFLTSNNSINKLYYLSKNIYNLLKMLRAQQLAAEHDAEFWARVELNRRSVPSSSRRSSRQQRLKR